MSMEMLAFATIGELQKKLAHKELSRQELLDFFMRRVEIFEPKVDAILEAFDKKSILEQSCLDKSQDTAVSENGILAGIPGFIKDNICIEGRVASCASRILQNFVAPYDATAIARLKAKGALFLGR